MKQIAIYLRLSLADNDLGKNGKDESNSIENQRLLIRSFLESHEEIIGEVIEYRDDGYSGTNFERPAFRQMIEDAKRGLIGTIIVKDLSRFGRDYIGVGDYLEQILPSLGIRFIAINSRYDSLEHGSSTLSLDVSISNMINNMYSKDLSKKLRSSFRAKWEDGENPSGIAPFGYLVNTADAKRSFMIDEEAAETVRLIFKYACKGYNTKTIAEKLNEQKLDTPMMYFVKKGFTKLPKNIKNVEEQLWSTNKVRSVIINDAYIGSRAHGKKEDIVVGNGKRKCITKSAVYVKEDAHPAIVSKTDFYTAQAVIHSQSKNRNWNSRKDAFSKKLVCGCCGSLLQVVNGDEHYVYCQHSQAIGSSSKCNKEYMNRDRITASVFEALQINVKKLTDLKLSLNKKLKEKYDGFTGTLEAKDKKLKDLSDELARHYENYVSGNLNRDSFIEIKKTIGEQKKEIELFLESKQRDKDSSEGTLFELNRTVNMGQAFFSKDKIPPEVVDAFVKKVVVFAEDRIEVQLNTTDIYEKALVELEKAKQSVDSD